MDHRVRKLGLAGLVVCMALLVAASGAQARRIHHVRGVVVHRNSHAGSFVVANGRGRLFAIHAAKSPALGSVVAVSVHRLRNHTFAARRVRAKGASNHVRIHGTVSHVNGLAKTFVVSAEGVSMLVKSGRLAASLPPVGRLVTVTPARRASQRPAGAEVSLQSIQGFVVTAGQHQDPGPVRRDPGDVAAHGLAGRVGRGLAHR